MCVGLCVRAWAAFECVSLKVSASFQVYGRPASVRVYHSLWCRCLMTDHHVTEHHALGLHRSLGPVTESTRAIAGLTLSESVRAVQLQLEHVDI